MDLKVTVEIDPSQIKQNDFDFQTDLIASTIGLSGNKSYEKASDGKVKNIKTDKITLSYHVTRETRV